VDGSVDETKAPVSAPTGVNVDAAGWRPRDVTRCPKVANKRNGIIGINQRHFLSSVPII
jgi:hypothetical protein